MVEFRLQKRKKQSQKLSQQLCQDLVQINFENEIGKFGTGPKHSFGKTNFPPSASGPNEPSATAPSGSGVGAETGQGAPRMPGTSGPSGLPPGVPSAGPRFPGPSGVGRPGVRGPGMAPRPRANAEDEAKIKEAFDHLIEMGYDRKMSEVAAALSHGNVEVALNYIEVVCLFCNELSVGNSWP